MQNKEGRRNSLVSKSWPFFLYLFLVYWLSERYRFIESFAGVVGCNKHLCLFLALTQRCSSQKRGIATLGKLHQLSDKDFLLGCRWYVMQYLILLRSVDTDVLGSAKIANLRIKVMGVNVIDWLLIKSRIYNLIRWTIKKRASFFSFLYSAMLQRPIDTAKIVTKNEISNKLNGFYLSSTVFHTIHSFYRKLSL